VHYYALKLKKSDANCKNMLDSFFTPIPEEIGHPTKGKKQLIGGKIKSYVHTFPSLKNVKVAIIGIDSTANNVRKAFYQLSWRFENMEIIDLGNLVSTGDPKQQEFALSESLAELISANIITVLMGGENPYLFGQFNAYRNLSDSIEIVNVCSGMNLETGSELHKIISQKPSNLFNIDFVGTQAYNISSNTSKLLEQNYFENHRLGNIRANIEEVEPLLRSAHALMFDLKSVRQSDAPDINNFSPNGLYAEEAVKIARYAGLSNTLNSASFYGLTQTDNSVTELLLAQMMWYFIEGATTRFYDHPVKNDPAFLIYRNKLESTGHEITFYKSRKSNRWWLEIPHPYENKTFFIGCSYTDYQLVCNGEMPDRWWRAYQRLI